MDRRTILLAALAFLIIACTTCNTTTTLPSTATEDALDVPSVDSGDILLYSDSDGEADSQIDSFPTTQRVLHFKTDVDPLNKDQKVRWVFTAVAAGDLVEEQISELNMDIPLDGVNTLNASLSNDTDWPSGLYRAEVYVDDELIKSGEFLIAKEK